MILNKTYDAVIVLGYKHISLENIPGHLAERLKKVAELYRLGKTKKIIVCGKWSISFDADKIYPKDTESEIMRGILLKEGIPDEDIIKEERSKDTIGNAYFVKRDIIVPHSYHKLLIACADYHLKRVIYIFSKVFGKDFEIDYLTTPTSESHNKDFMMKQGEIYKNQRTFLEEMNVGDDSYLSDKLYNDSY